MHSYPTMHKMKRYPRHITTTCKICPNTPTLHPSSSSSFSSSCTSSRSSEPDCPNGELSKDLQQFVQHSEFLDHVTNMCWQSSELRHMWTCLFRIAPPRSGPSCYWYSGRAYGMGYHPVLMTCKEIPGKTLPISPLVLL